MTTGPVQIEITDSERALLVAGLNEYLGPAKGSLVLGPLVGVADQQGFFRLVNEFMTAIETGQALSGLDWTRALLLTEIAWASDILGAASEIQTSITDERALPLLRSLQRKLVTGERTNLLITNAASV